MSIDRRTCAVAAAIASLAIAGCGSSSSGGGGGGSSGSSGGQSGGQSGGGGGQSGGGGSGQSGTGGGKLALGQETTLQGLGEEKLKVRVLRIVDPMKNPPPHGLLRETPQKGRRFVGVYIKLTNLGKKTYSDSPLNGSRLVTDKPNAGSPTILQSGRCQSKTMGIGLRLKAGTTRTGCLPFQVKVKAKVSGFRFTLDSGQGPQTAEWTRR